MRKPSIRLAALLLALALLLSLAACGNEARATTMHLKHTEGTVAVSDDTGEDVPLLEDLGLYSGYGVDTRSASFAWINLDDVKLTKMDEDSEIAIQKEGKLLEIEVKSGSLFFNVTQPLEEDETMNIRTSTMLVGIRGTCGWVEVPDPAHMNVYLLEGTVECTAGTSSATVQGGEMAAMTGDGEITVTAFTVWNVPAFVLGETKDDDGLAAAILDDSGIDVSGPAVNALDTYTKLLARLVDRLGGEVLLTEEIDFEGDGSPELLVLARQPDEDYPDYELGKFWIFPKGEALPQNQLLGGNFFLSDNYGKPPIFQVDTVSLVEWEGRLLLRTDHEFAQMEGASVFQGGWVSYWGPAAQDDGGSHWGRVDGVGYSDRIYDGRDIIPGGYASSSYQRCAQSGDGLREGAYERSTAEEYNAVLAQYPVVRVIWES